MNLEKFLVFVTHHNEAIIQWLFFAILLLSGALIARSLFGKKTDDVAPAAGPAQVGLGDDLQSALEKILAQTSKLEAVSLEKEPAKPSPEMVAELQSLKADLAARETELNQLKATATSQPENAGGPSPEQTAELATRIKELEAKLSEYEILEDDIADLSLYKEENARLKTELEKLKSGVSVGTPPVEAAAAVAMETPPAAAEAPPAVEAPPGGEDIVAEFAQAVTQEPKPTGPTEKVEVPNTGDPMADFASTVKMEKQIATEATPEPVSTGEADDLFAEFANASPEANASESLDTDKMMAEMAALVSMEPSSSNSLEESVDTEKMAAEASDLQKS